MALFLYDDLLPSRLLNQHFGLGLTGEDLLPVPSPVRSWLLGPGYYRPWRVSSQDTGSTVKYDKDKFQVNLDVQHFGPEEVTVKTVDDSIVIEGKHEEKKDEHGLISRHFVRRYVLPKEYDIQALQSSLSSDGVLTITAPKNLALQAQEKVIPIAQTGEPHKAIKQEPAKEEQKK